MFELSSPASVVFLLSAVCGLLLFLAIRVAPFWPQRHRGCDAFYFLMAAEDFRRHRRLPLNLPGLYLLEPDEQWYPPGFAVFLGLLPRQLSECSYWVISHILDTVVLAALALWLLAFYGPLAALAGMLAYAASAFIILEYSSLTSRPLGVVLQMGFLVTSYAWVQGSEVTLVGAVLLGVLLLFTHKLSVQLLWFLVPFLALANWEPRWLLPLGISYLTAMAIGPRQFQNILKAHWDIISFWNRNWPLLGAHLVRNSPVYGNGEVGVGYHGRGNFLAILTHGRRILQYNPWIIVVPMAVADVHALDGFEIFLLQWIAGTYIWAVCTLYVGPLKCLGEGTKYIKYAIPPSLALVFGPILETNQGVGSGLIVAAAILQLFLYLVIWRDVRRGPSEAGVRSPELDTLLALISRTDGIRLMCLPLHLPDLVAYVTRKPVLWGTHSYGFREVEPFFPVMKKPISFFVEKYRLTHLLLDRCYTTLDELRLPPHSGAIEAGKYMLYPFAPISVDSAVKQS